MVPVCVFLLFGAAASLLTPRLHVFHDSHSMSTDDNSNNDVLVCVFVRL